jgi:hypothetical protein
MGWANREAVKTCAAARWKTRSSPIRHQRLPGGAEVTLTIDNSDGALPIGTHGGVVINQSRTPSATAEASMPSTATIRRLLDAGAGLRIPVFSGDARDRRYCGSSRRPFTRALAERRAVSFIEEMRHPQASLRRVAEDHPQARCHAGQPHPAEWTFFLLGRSVASARRSVIRPKSPRRAQSIASTVQRCAPDCFADES